MINWAKYVSFLRKHTQPWRITKYASLAASPTRGKGPADKSHHEEAQSNCSPWPQGHLLWIKTSKVTDLIILGFVRKWGFRQDLRPVQPEIINMFRTEPNYESLEQITLATVRRTPHITFCRAANLDASVGLNPMPCSHLKHRLTELYKNYTLSLWLWNLDQWLQHS